VKVAASSIAVALRALVVAVSVGSAARTRAAVRCSGAGRPVLKYPNLYAVGRFRCETGERKATEIVVLQGFERGKWTTLESAARRREAQTRSTMPAIA
jgi:hypothetical protein